MADPHERETPDAGQPEVRRGAETRVFTRRLSRRRFLTYLLALTGTMGAGGLASPILRFAYPVEETQVAPRQEVGTLAALTPLGEAVEFDYQDHPAALIMLADGTPKALSRVCTHFGCIVDWQPDEEIFYCPCHAGIFSPQGEVLGGPPPRPLPELNITVEDGTVFVEGWRDS